MSDIVDLVNERDALLAAIEKFYHACNGFDPDTGEPYKIWSAQAEVAADALFAMRDAALAQSGTDRVRHGGGDETTVLRSYDGVVGNNEPCSHDGAIDGNFMDEPGGRR